MFIRETTAKPNILSLHLRASISRLLKAAGGAAAFIDQIHIITTGFLLQQSARRIIRLFSPEA
jgi:hypothetical protein